MKPDFIVTYTGQHIKPWEPEFAEIRIKDIAHGLAYQCRFNGHSRMFYSVAEHSVHVSRRVRPELALWGLMHDAAEAYIGDLVTPLKAEIPAFHDLETNWLAYIETKYSLSEWPEIGVPAGVKLADEDMLRWELYHLLHYGDMPSTDNPKIACWSPEQAEQEFLRRFLELI